MLSQNAAFDRPAPEKKPTVVVLETGVVGSLDYKIIEATRADDLFQWLKDNKYKLLRRRSDARPLHPEKMALHFMKIDTMQMKAQQGRTFDAK